MGKNFLLLSICAVIASLCIVPVSAHSGGTDSKGGHWNHSTGEYHYHHGYSAHDHYDMDNDGDDDCPYEFDAETVSVPNSSSSYDKGYSAGKNAGMKEGYNSGYADGEKAANIAIEERIKQERKSASSLAYALSFFIGIPIAAFLFNCRSSSREQRLQNEIITLKNDLRTVKNNSNYHSISSSASIPIGTSSRHINKSINNCQQFGVNTVYISKGGKKYHCKYRCSNATTPVNIEDLPKGYSACRNCVPKNKIR